jgi:hypothetical protein
MTWVDLKRTARRQRLVKHLHECGPRPVLEATLELESGPRLDEVLESYVRLDPAQLKASGADELPFEQVGVIDGGTS